MICLVTGAAGFVGSHLSEHLLLHGHEVRGVDCFTDYYDHSTKERNIVALRDAPGFTLAISDLAEAPLDPLLDGAEMVFHLAGQPGVRPSWGREFDTYVRNNIQVTQRLLEACRRLSLRAFVYASSSSVYGNAESFPTSELARPRPVSPYGVTKLAGEHLVELYRSAFGIPAASLRLFTVYGPRQRPDMAFWRLIDAAVNRGRFDLYGDGEQTRDFTFIDDVVRAFHDVAFCGWHGVANVGGGSRTSMNEVIATVTDICGPVDIARHPSPPGDARHTAADIRLARDAFAYSPQTSLSSGLEIMVAWARSLVGASAR